MRERDAVVEEIEPRRGSTRSRERERDVDEAAAEPIETLAPRGSATSSTRSAPKRDEDARAARERDGVDDGLRRTR